MTRVGQEYKGQGATPVYWNLEPNSFYIWVAHAVQCQITTSAWNAGPGVGNAWRGIRTSGMRGVGENVSVCLCGVENVTVSVGVRVSSAVRGIGGAPVNAVLCCDRS